MTIPATVPRVRNVNKRATPYRPHVSAAARCLAKALGVGDRAAQARHDRALDLLCDIVAAHRDAGTMDALNARLALFDACRRDGCAERLDQVLRAKVAADCAEDLARHDYQRDPSPASARRYGGALRLEHAQTGELIAALEA